MIIQEYRMFKINKEKHFKDKLDKLILLLFILQILYSTRVVHFAILLFYSRLQEYEVASTTILLKFTSVRKNFKICEDRFSQFYWDIISLRFIRNIGYTRLFLSNDNFGDSATGKRLITCQQGLNQVFCSDIRRLVLHDQMIQIVGITSDFSPQPVQSLPLSLLRINYCM